MGLNIKNREVEALAAEVAVLARETKTEAIRRALEERKARLAALGNARSTRRTIDFLNRHIWPKVPADVLGKAITKQEREEILGYGPDGV